MDRPTRRLYNHVCPTLAQQSNASCWTARIQVEPSRISKYKFSKMTKGLKSANYPAWCILALALMTCPAWADLSDEQENGE